jgi:MFS family permease
MPGVGAQISWAPADGPEMSLTPSELADERRRGRAAGSAAIASGLLFPAGLIWAQLINRDRPEDNAPAELRFFDRHAGALLASSILRAIALGLLVIVALYLYRATKARKPDLNPMIGALAVVGPVLLAVGGLAHDVYLAFASADFTGRASQTISSAEDLTKSMFIVITVGMSIAGTLALAFWFVTASLNAMRVGLLSRLMGVLGVIIGPAFVLGLAPAVMVVWLVAIGFLFLDRWPTKRPRAWTTGEATPLPGPAERSGQAPAPQEEIGGSRNGDVDPVGPGVRKPGDDEAGSAASARGRQKRKRRR